MAKRKTRILVVETRPEMMTSVFYARVDHPETDLDLAETLAEAEEKLRAKKFDGVILHLRVASNRQEIIDFVRRHGNLSFIVHAEAGGAGYHPQQFLDKLNREGIRVRVGDYGDFVPAMLRQIEEARAAAVKPRPRRRQRRSATPRTRRGAQGPKRTRRRRPR